ncbi:MAG: hypothetical protein K6D59_04560 [Bacteroidales bacterium]|nr:hypothetical protein [Bacteroidales bacterium]
MMKKLFLLPLSALMLCLLFSSCKKDNPKLHFDYDGPCHCGVANPLEDLEWLHNTAEQFESMRDKQWARIFICKFDSSKQGFIIDPCVNCDDAMQSFFDCEGNLLGNLGGIAGIPISTYNIDPASVSEIYRNYPDTAATLVDKSWQLKRFFDRETQTSEIPMQGNNPIPFWLYFQKDGTIVGGGINQLNGSYALYEQDHIYISIGTITEIYDATGCEERMVNALNDATICDVSYNGTTMRIYYDMNRKYMDFIRAQ